MRQKLVKVAIMVFVFSFVQLNTWAQCAMCRASVENNASNGDTALASSLNTGILYLFATPYLAIGIVAGLWYYNSKKNVSKNVKGKRR